MPWMVSVMTSARVPPRQIRRIARVRKRIIRNSKVGMVSPRTVNSWGRFSIWMKNLAAIAGMIMFASISAKDRRDAPKTLILRL